MSKNDEMLNKAKQLVAKYFNDCLIKEQSSYYQNLCSIDEDFQLTTNDVFVVWFCKTLQNWKALVSTTPPDGMYYEVTYNGDKKETYVDAYRKWQNVQFQDDAEF